MTLQSVIAKTIGPLRLGPALAALAVVGLVAIGSAFGLFRPFNNAMTDWRFALSSHAPSGNIVFVEIDPASLRKVGVWPWPRHVYADLLDRLMDLGAAETVFDIDFSSASTETEDKAFADALQRAGGYAALAAFRQYSPVTDRLEVTLPLARFRAAADAVMVNVVAEQDGLVRRYPSGATIDGKAYPSLAEFLASAPLAATDKVYLDYGIDASAIDRISVADVLAGTVDPARIANKQVVIGASAQELRDLFTVPRFGTMPGPLLQVMAAETLKQHRALHGVSPLIPPAIVLLLGLLFFLRRGRGGLWREVATAVGILMVVEAAALVAQVYGGLLLRTGSIDAALFAYVASAVLQELESKRRQHAAAARERDAMQRILDRVIADNFDGVVVIDEAGRILTASDMADALLSDGAPLVGRPARALLPDNLGSAVQQALEATEGDVERPTVPSELTLELGGMRRTLEYVVTRSEIVAARGQARSVVCLTFRDISERRRNEERLAFLARHDALTGALSRLPFVRAVEDALTHAADREQGLTLLVLDLGRFSMINDMLGHSFGDLVIKEVVRRLEALDLLAVGRVGGDSFAIARRGILGAAESKHFALTVIEAIVEPYALAGRRAVLTARAGVTNSALSGCSGDMLLSHADMALAAAKATAGSAAEVFALDMAQEMLDKQEMESALRQAIADGGLEVHYQPQVSLATGELVGVEALMRWHHPALGSVSPARFIPVAEETGLIVELGRFLLETACRDAANWPAHVRMAVNISPVQFELGDVVREVRTALSTWGLPAERLDIEITEGLFVDNTHPARLALERLQSQGIGVALDDFGTGYSSLSYLSRLPIDKLKIDRSFVSDLPKDRDAMAVVTAMLTLAQTLGKTTVAEGIETEAQATALRRAGCQIGQGYLYGKAMPAAELKTRFLTRRRLQVVAGLEASG